MAAASRRRVPSVLLGLAGAAIAIAYAALAEKMRFGAPLVMVGLGGMTLVLSAMALWRVVDPLSRGDAGAALSPQSAGHQRELERQYRLVVKAIKEIELDFQMRKIAEPDFKEMDQRYRARAMRLLSEIKAGDNYRELIERELKDRLATVRAREEAPEASAAAVATAATPVCAACNAQNDQDAQFCKKCGAKLERA
jgi:ribosomal protein L40E